jgi:hypothetical protein
MGHQDNNTNESPGPISADERQLIDLYRRCSPRRRAVITRFASKLAVLEWPMSGRHDITNILQFKRRKDD